VRPPAKLKTRREKPHEAKAELYARTYFTLFIHFRIGPLTETSAVFGENTSDMWLWSLNSATVGQWPALQS
jgi:hypothetical protein